MDIKSKTKGLRRKEIPDNLFVISQKKLFVPTDILFGKFSIFLILKLLSPYCFFVPKKNCGPHPFH